MLSQGGQGEGAREARRGAPLDAARAFLHDGAPKPHHMERLDSPRTMVCMGLQGAYSLLRCGGAKLEVHVARG
jgi:hypothetical protein